MVGWPHNRAILGFFLAPRRATIFLPAPVPVSQPNRRLIVQLPIIRIPNVRAFCALGALTLSCAGGDSDSGDGATTNAGGNFSTGGMTQTGASPATAGAQGTGGTTGSGGAGPGDASGGANVAAGGLSTDGGEPGAGGEPGNGGEPNSAGGAPSTAGSGGETASGGAPTPDLPPAAGGPNAGPPKHSGELLAFPGAEGFARKASGGRGGEVYHVTTLNDSGPGSLRDAVSVSGRIVVFDVGGIIKITDRVVIKKNITIAGQTAPGGGITIYGNGVALNGDSGNDIIRYIRIRMGKNGDAKKDALAISDGQNYMFDHTSISWGKDGTFDLNGQTIDNVTLQDTIIGQGINISNHSTGGLMQGGKWSVIRSLYIDNKTRNPKARGTHEFINSVLYNWASNGYIMGDTSGVSECNLVGNYFIYGPSSSSGSHITNTTAAFRVYGADNWVDDNKNGQLDGTLMTSYKTATVVNTPFPHPAGVDNKLSAKDALNHVLEHVGASLVRDAVDELLINQVKSYGKEGKIIATEDDNGIPGGVGTVAGGTPPKDTDRDGMPDEWESGRGLDPNKADDKGDDDNDGYTNIEEYLSCLVGEGDC